MSFRTERSGVRNLLVQHNYYLQERIAVCSLLHNMTVNRFRQLYTTVYCGSKYIIPLKSHKGAQDSGNGSYPRSFSSLSRNRVRVNIPRSRNGGFKPLAVDLINPQAEQIRDLALLLHRKGNSSRDVSYILKHFFGELMSRERVNNLADSFQEIREEWEKQRLDAHYKVIYCDALFVRSKEETAIAKRLYT